MALITIPNIFSAGATIVASQHNSNFSVIASDYNGNIDNNNIANSAAIAYSKLALTGSIVNADVNASAAIVDSKLAQITTASKVSGAALTSLASIPSGAGVIPISNLATGTPDGTKFVKDDGTLSLPYSAYTAGTRVISSANTERTTTTSTYTKVKEFYIANAGTIRVSFDIKSTDANAVYARVYRNGSAVGVEKTDGTGSYVTYTDDVSGWSSGDLLQVYYHTFSPGVTSWIKNVFIEVNNPHIESNTLD